MTGNIQCQEQTRHIWYNTHMYLITGYFDDTTGNILKHHIEEIASITGNAYMTDNHIPPHMTLCMLEARDVGVLIPGFRQFAEASRSCEVIIASVGMLFPYVMYAAPVPNEELMNMSQRLTEIYGSVADVSIARYYTTDHWMPHITLAKRLDGAQMQRALAKMRDSFTPFIGRIVEVGLSEVNPHRDVERIRLI